VGRLTVAKARRASRPGLHGDGGTLYLRIAPGGSKSWIQRLTIDGERHDIGLGSFPLVTLAEARDKAFENRRLARRGGDPLAEKRKARAPTFRQAAERTFEANRQRWRNAKTAKNWMQGMERHAFPSLGGTRVDRIGREDVLRVLTPIWTDRPEVARKLRQRIRATLAWCEAHGHVDRNVAGSAIDGALPAMPAVRAHLRSLPYREVPAALDVVDASHASVAARSCLRFVVLTAARSSEALGARWSEMDVDARQWRIPGSRMKSGREHRVPLAGAAMEVLDRVRPLQDDSDLVFPSPLRPGKPMSNMTLQKLLRDNGLSDRATVHGFRSSFRDWCAETGRPRELAEAALAHAVGGVEGAYFRSDLFERRRHLMAAWADHALGHVAQVVELRRG